MFIMSFWNVFSPFSLTILLAFSTHSSISFMFSVLAFSSICFSSVSFRNTSSHSGYVVPFTVFGNETGHYVVQVDNLSGEFQALVWVNWWLIGGLITAFALLGWLAWYYGYYRRKHLRPPR